MSSAPKTEAAIVYGLVEIRKLLEQGGHKGRFPRLVFFCDWVVHPWLKGRETRNVLMELDRRLGRYDASRPWEIDEDGMVHELLSLRQFAGELNACCRENGIGEIWTQDLQVWRDVSRLYTEIVQDCPLTMTRRDYGSNYLATLEIDSCEPNRAIVEANPQNEHIGWNWRFTLSDGRIFNMPFTAGYKKEVEGESQD